ncbi:hypothetical protein [Cohnella endophytica]|nr:hypothetical protein [Cohnella endophytica]
MSSSYTKPIVTETSPRPSPIATEAIPVYAEELPKTIREARTAKEAIAIFETNIPLLKPDELDRLLMELEEFYRSDADHVNAALRSANESGLFSRFSNPVGSDQIDEIQDEKIRTIISEAIEGKYKFNAGEGVLVPIVDYRALTSYASFVTPAMADYLELMATASDKPAFGDGSILIPRTELGERALQAEQYLNDYPYSPRFDRVKAEFGLNLGLLFGGSSNSEIYDENKRLIPEVKEAWNTAAAHKDTLTGKLSKDRILLSDKITSSFNKGKISVETFYQEIRKFRDRMETRINAYYVNRTDPAQVQWIAMSHPIPMGIANLLFPDEKQAEAAQLLQWLAEADEVDGEGMTQPLHGRSMAANIVYRDGKTLEIRPAWSCDTEKSTEGSTGTSCTPVKDYVWIGDSKGQSWFALSPFLFEFVNSGYKASMPDVIPYHFPNAIRLGESFKIEGRGSTAEKTYLQLSQGNKVVWRSDETKVDHGAFEITGKLDAAKYKAGDYELRIVGIPYKGFESFEGGEGNGIQTSIQVTD